MAHRQPAHIRSGRSAGDAAAHRAPLSLVLVYWCCCWDTAVQSCIYATAVDREYTAVQVEVILNPNRVLTHDTNQTNLPRVSISQGPHTDTVSDVRSHIISQHTHAVVTHVPAREMPHFYGRRYQCRYHASTATRQHTSHTANTRSDSHSLHDRKIVTAATHSTANHKRYAHQISRRHRPIWARASTNRINRTKDDAR